MKLISHTSCMGHGLRGACLGDDHPLKGTHSQKFAIMHKNNHMI